MPGKDVTQEIKAKAMELGFCMVGITAYDNQYTFKSKRNWIKPFPNAVCLAMEQPFESTQNIPSAPSEREVFVTYRREGTAALELAAYVRSLGYHAQIQDTAGLGQRGNTPVRGGRHGPAGSHGLPSVTVFWLATKADPTDYRRSGDP